MNTNKPTVNFYVKSQAQEKNLVELITKAGYSINVFQYDTDTTSTSTTTASSHAAKTSTASADEATTTRKRRVRNAAGELVWPRKKTASTSSLSA